VISFEPDFEEIREPAIFRNIARRKMTVVVEDRLGRSELMIETARDVVREKEIFSKEASHGRDL
jgi:C4-type Zn-finger protein